jgi:hypothetical protein
MALFVNTHINVRKNSGKRVVDRGMGIDYRWLIGYSVLSAIIPFII